MKRGDEAISRLDDSRLRTRIDIFGQDARGSERLLSSVQTRIAAFDSVVHARV